MRPKLGERVAGDAQDAHRDRPHVVHEVDHKDRSARCQKADALQELPPRDQPVVRLHVHRHGQQPCAAQHRAAPHERHDLSEVEVTLEQVHGHKQDQAREGGARYEPAGDLLGVLLVHNPLSVNDGVSGNAHTTNQRMLPVLIYMHTSAGCQPLFSLFALWSYVHTLSFVDEIVIFLLMDLACGVMAFKHDIANPKPSLQFQCYCVAKLRCCNATNKKFQNSNAAMLR